MLEIKSPTKRNRLSSGNELVGFFSLQNDALKRVWAISSGKKYLIEPSNVLNYFSKILKFVTKDDFEKIPAHSSTSDANLTLRKKLAGKFIQDPTTPGYFWYVDTKYLNKRLVNQFELIDFLLQLSLPLSQNDFNKIADGH
jgi:hypothetical protein